MSGIQPAIFPGLLTESDIQLPGVFLSAGENDVVRTHAPHLDADEAFVL
jgi:hypothetical protein